MHPFVSGPVGVGSLLVACGEYKKLDFFLKNLHVSDLVHKCCSDINEGRWIPFLFYSVLLATGSAFVEKNFLHRWVAS